MVNPSAHIHNDILNNTSLRTSGAPSPPIPARPVPPHEYGDIPACKWGNKELKFYKIHRQLTTAWDFFRITAEEMRSPQWAHPEYADLVRYQDPLTYTAESAGADKVYELLVLLRDIHIRNRSLPVSANQLESWTAAALKHLLQLIRMDIRGELMIRDYLPIRFLSKGKDTYLNITGIYDQAQMLYLLLLTEEKCFEADCTPFGQLVASAIAGFQHNNAIRVKNRKLALDFMIIPGIIWIGGLPSFYHIKVTRWLSEAVKTGNPPFDGTFVPEHYPPITPELSMYGLWHLHNRAVVMKILENLKDFVPKDYDDIPVGWNRVLIAEERYVLEEQMGRQTTFGRKAA